MNTINRRQFLKGAAALSAGAGMPVWARQAAAAAAVKAAHDDRILVVLELSGGNDGLNCVVPYADDAYYRQRPELGIPKQKLFLLDDHFGLNPGMLGFQRLWE